MLLKPGDERYLDGDGIPRQPLGLLLVLLFLLRGYAAWIVSLTFSDDRSKLLGFFYNTPEQFGLALLVGLPALVVLALSVMMRPKCAGWLLSCWRQVQVLLIVAWLLDGVLLISLVAQNWPGFAPQKATLILAWCWVIWYLLKSRHWRRFRILFENHCKETELKTGKS